MTDETIDYLIRERHIATNDIPPILEAEARRLEAAANLTKELTEAHVLGVDLTVTPAKESGPPWWERLNGEVLFAGTIVAVVAIIALTTLIA